MTNSPHDARSERTRWTREAIEARVRALGGWFHNLDIDGVATAPDHFLGDYPRAKFRRFEHALPRDLTGKSVLDIGCNAGFYSLEMKRRGAARVLAIDSDDRYLSQARFAAEVAGADIEFRKMDVYDVGSLRERFDLVLFMGVLYHLRHPLLALDLVRRHVVGDTMLFQSMLRGSSEIDAVREDYDFAESDHFDRPGYPKMHFVERSYSKDETNWWIPNRACVEAMLRTAGFAIETRAEDEVYVCRAAEIPSFVVGPPRIAAADESEARAGR
jgi:tRNA (mo5U34)-methyltransferase